MAKEVFKAVVEPREGLTMACKVREFEMLLDEPVELGGNNKAMNPVEALLSSLGACKAIVMRCFAPAHNINLVDFKIELEGDLDPDGFLGKNPEAKIGFSEVRTHITIDAENTQEEIEAFIEFVEKTCPVQDTLVNAANYKIIIN
ncbi:OsmC family protein [Microaceticoccus formicicus]|uniref:OsmC family protein n=1 Tax=Microaceticoccus formicicus TaxID=3118105 RepID=UPI003CD01916|nr:OsmC family protein [Peptoniphilaceae bacterium AMB_02]